MSDSALHRKRCCCTTKANLVIVLEGEICCLLRKLRGKRTCTVWAKCAEYVMLYRDEYS